MEMSMRTFVLQNQVIFLSNCGVLLGQHVSFLADSTKSFSLVKGKLHGRSCSTDKRLWWMVCYLPTDLFETNVQQDHLFLPLWGVLGYFWAPLWQRIDQELSLWSWERAVTCDLCSTDTEGKVEMKCVNRGIQYHCSVQGRVKRRVLCR